MESHQCANDPNWVTPEQRVRDFDENERLVVLAKKLLCTACGEVVLKKSIVELHVDRGVPTIEADEAVVSVKIIRYRMFYMYKYCRARCIY